MKSVLNIIFLCYIFLISCNSDKNATTIIGRIEGEIPEKVFYSFPVNGVCNNLFIKSVDPDSLGNFKVELQLPKTTFIEFFVGEENRLIVEPGETYDIKLLSNAKENDFIVKNVSTAQAFYNGLEKMNPRFCFYEHNEDTSNYQWISQGFDKQRDKEIISLEVLARTDQISDEIYQLLKLDRQVYYTTAQAMLASKCNLLFAKYNIDTPSKVFDIWRKVKSEVPLDNPSVIQSAHFFDFLDLYVWYHVYQDYSIEELRRVRNNKSQEGLIHTHSIDLAKQYLPEEYQEYYIAAYVKLKSLQLQNEKEAEFFEVINQYKQDYPNSRYTIFFNDFLEKLDESPK